MYITSSWEMICKEKAKVPVFFSIMMVQPAVIVIIGQIVPILSPEHP